MKKYPIATIVNFCTNDWRFIGKNLEQALLFSQEVIVVVCDHFFDGSGENRSILQAVYAAFPDCHFIEYPFIPDRIPKSVWKRIEKAHFWHSLSRLLGFCFVGEEIPFLLFLDADEIVDAKRFSLWLEEGDYALHSAIKLANYWYFKDPSYQAIEREDSPVLARKSAIEERILLHGEERDALYRFLPHPKKRNVLGLDNKPMIHHYSWVRTREEMLKKVRTWGHKKDCDWEALVEKEYREPFSGTDFIHGYRYKVVKPFFSLPQDLSSLTPKGPAFARKLKAQEVLKRVRKKRFWDFLRA